MENDKIKELREFYRSLLGIKHVLEKASTPNIRSVTVAPLLNEFKRLNEEFPELSLSKSGYNFEALQKKSKQDGLFSRVAVQSVLEIVLARVEVAIDDQSDTPVTERKQFAFVNNDQLKMIIERDYLEIQRASSAKCWKSVIILCGGTIEAILTDLLIANEGKAKAAKSAPSKKADITHWDLSDLISVAAELNLVTEGVEKLSSPIREYRNLVHPGNELRNKRQVDAEEASIAVAILNIVHRDLSMKG